MNLANKITILRILSIPLFVFFMSTDIFGEYGKWIALTIFCLASITDLIDGYLARKYNCITSFGKFIDPLADKLLVGAALICLVGLNLLQAWVVVVIISREFIISGFRLVASDRGVVIAASVWGKVKTTFQMIMIIVLIADFGGIFQLIGTILIWISLVLTVVSLVDYILKNKNVFAQEK
jgi:CDP-diacylglycerol--glycerol-3-phosphate 3-phosphatidyltransferase